MAGTHNSHPYSPSRRLLSIPPDAHTSQSPPTSRHSSPRTADSVNIPNRNYNQNSMIRSPNPSEIAWNEAERRRPQGRILASQITPDPRQNDRSGMTAYNSHFNASWTHAAQPPAPQVHTHAQQFVSVIMPQYVNYGSISLFHQPSAPPAVVPQGYSVPSAPHTLTWPERTTYATPPPHIVESHQDQGPVREARYGEGGLHRVVLRSQSSWDSGRESGCKIRNIICRLSECESAFMEDSATASGEKSISVQLGMWDTVVRRDEPVRVRDLVSDIHKIFHEDLPKEELRDLRALVGDARWNDLLPRMQEVRKRRSSAESWARRISHKFAKIDYLQADNIFEGEGAIYLKRVSSYTDSYGVRLDH